MKKKIVAISCILSAFFLFGCPPPKYELEPINPTDCGVSNLKVDVKDSGMNVSWENNCDKNIAGYYVYISANAHETVPFNHTPFDGDTNPEDGVEIFVADNLENGKKYFVSVKILNSDQTLSNRSYEIVAVCGPREEIELALRYKGVHDGYSLSKNEYVRADNDFNDFYFFSKDGKDYLQSPDQLDGFLRKSEFVVLDYKGEFKELKTDINKHKKLPTKTKVEVKVFDWILIETAENRNALARVLGFTGSGKERNIKLFVAFSPLKNELIF